MKKAVLSLILALTLALGCYVSASAANYIPDNVTYQNLNGQQLGIKVFTLLPDQDPADLVEPDYEYDGYLYSYSSKIINRADVGGQYLNEWQTANAIRATTVYRFENPTPLPKAGN